VQAEELGSGLELGEGAGQIHVRKNSTGFLGLVCAAEKHGVRALADQLDSIEVLDDRRHRQGQDAAAGERPGGRPRRRLQLLFADVETFRAQQLGQARARTGGVVGQEAQPMTGLAQAANGAGGSRNRLARDAQHAVDVDQDRGHVRESIDPGREMGVCARASSAEPPEHSLPLRMPFLRRRYASERGGSTALLHLRGALLGLLEAFTFLADVAGREQLP